MKNTIVSILLLATLAVAPIGETSTSGPFAAVANLYELVRLELLEDSTEGVPQLGRAIVFELRELQADFSARQAGVSEDRAEALRSALPEMIKSAESLANSSRLEETRLAFYALSKDLVRWRAGVNYDQKPAVAYCAMEKKSWLQPIGEIGNPYAGSKMPLCGEFVSD